MLLGGYFLVQTAVFTASPDPEIVQPLAIQTNARISVLSSHPDDSGISCGGALITLKQQGIKQIRCLIMTSGNHASIEGVEDPNDRTAIRREEAIKEMQVLGIEDYDFLNLPFYEHHRMPGKEDRDIILRELTKFQPDTIFLPYRGDTHSTHQAITSLTLDALNQLPQERRENIALYFCETPWGIFPSDGFNTIFPLSDEMLQQKILAIRKHISQLNRTRFDLFARYLADMRAITVPEQVGLGSKPFELGKHLEVFYKSSAHDELRKTGIDK
jgi:LmbE family N-acetylglucosaminyl deacetylase